MSGTAMAPSRGTTPERRRQGRIGGPRRWTALALTGAIGLGGGLVAVGASGASASTHGQAPNASKARAASAMLQVLAVAKYGRVLADSHHHTLYLLSSEHGSAQVCNAACQKFWPPLTVGAKQKATVGSGVSGKIGYISRGKAIRQVTFNGYPLFYFAPDTAAGQTKGEGIKAFGGTWTLVRPSAKSAAATLVLGPAKKTGAPKHSTSTTKASSGY